VRVVSRPASEFVDGAPRLAAGMREVDGSSGASSLEKRGMSRKSSF